MDVTITIPEDEVLHKWVWGWLVKRRAGNKCERCGTTEALQAHHKDRLGNHVLANGECLCKTCHDAEHAEARSARLAKFNRSPAGRAMARRMWDRLDADPVAKAAFIASRNTGKKCEPGCTCKRHDRDPEIAKRAGATRAARRAVGLYDK